MSHHQDSEGGELLGKYGAVEFLIKFAEFLQGHKLTDVAADCQSIVRNLVKRGADQISFEPIRQELKAQVSESATEEKNKETDRKRYRREQPLIEENIKQRTINDDNTTESTEALLRKDKNKMELLLNPVLNAEIFMGNSVLKRPREK